MTDNNQKTQRSWNGVIIALKRLFFSEKQYLLENHQAQNLVQELIWDNIPFNVNYTSDDKVIIISNKGKEIIEKFLSR